MYFKLCFIFSFLDNTGITFNISAKAEENRPTKVPMANEIMRLIILFNFKLILKKYSKLLIDAPNAVQFWYKQICFLVLVICTSLGIKLRREIKAEKALPMVTPAEKLIRLSKMVFIFSPPD